MAVIAINGSVGSGKDTAGTIIKEHGKLNWQIVKFAGALKKASALITNLEDQYSHVGKQQLVPGLDMTVGEFQQKLGEGLKKEIHPLIWVKALFSQYDENQNWIITDMRYKDEADYLREMGASLWRIDGTWDGIEKLREGRDMNHRSEIDLDNYAHFDIQIMNDKAEGLFVSTITQLVKSLDL